MKLFEQPLRPINLGLESFYDSMASQGAEPVAVDWRPPLDGFAELSHTRAGLDIDAANVEAVRRICAGRPMLVGMGIARDVIPGFAPSGQGAPVDHPQRPADRLGPHVRPDARRDHGRADLRGAGRDAGGSGRAGRVRRDRVRAVPPLRRSRSDGRHHQPVDAGVHRAKRDVRATSAYATQNEGLGKVLRYGAYGPEVIRRLKWMETDPLPGAEGGAGDQRPDRSAQHDRPGAAHGRRVPQPQQGRHLALYPHDRAGAG